LKHYVSESESFSRIFYLKQRAELVGVP